MQSLGRYIGIISLIATLISPSCAEAFADPDGVTFFEQKIRPVLVKECYSCHSADAKALKGGLRVDSRAGLLAGGDSGPAVVPGKPEESPLLDALRHDGIAMPPKSKLSSAIVADFERWIKIGLPDPRLERSKAKAKALTGMTVEKGRSFWAYQPPRRVAAPEVADLAWPRGELDRFILAALESSDIKPVRDADRATLARRLYFDLIGLPPTPEEVDAFVNETSPMAYEMLVDRLLSSPHFGERWGRHWLDVVRYAESLTLRGLVFKQAWRFRDFVIDSFNNDMPYDRFIREQVAGDLLPSANLDDRREKLVATSFLSLGNTNLEEQDKPQLVMDVVDEQIDTIGKAFLGQTIGCARCHDHKFDPIPTRDYYAMAGILRNTKTLEHANVSAWLERPLPVVGEREKILKNHEQRVASLEAQIKAARGKVGTAKGNVPKQVFAVSELPGVVVDDGQAKKVGEWKESQHSQFYIAKGYLHDMDTGKGEKTLTFLPELKAAGAYEVWLAYSPGKGRSKAVPVAILSADGDTMVHVDMSAPPPIDGRYVSLGRYQFESNGQGYVMISNEGTTGYVTADAVLFIPHEAGDGAAQVVAGKAKPVDTGAQENATLVAKLEKELKRLKADGPTRELFMGVEEVPEIEDIRVHVRGSVHTLGEPAPRGVLTVATYGKPPTMPSHESGRRELADWLADERNPLTARVYVNRVWHWLFGTGLVRTTDNFGTTGETPSHPELLDHLALQFMEEGWSVKTLIRRIVLSRTYRLSSVDDPQARAADPENRLLWKMSRRRLDAECIQDTILSVSGTLDPQMKGLSFRSDLATDYGYTHLEKRRSVYSPVFRNALPELFEVFDFADPSMVVGRRNVSTVAPQALFLLNHPFVLEQSKQAAHRLLARPGLDDGGRIDRIYQLALGRRPAASERRIGLSFLAQNTREGKPDDEGAWALLFQAVFASVDFRYVN
ncbi:DUF1553 domain-containing protein [Singulisphaera acidiphila]|uniref:Cytochrome c domain-containing protein n=1 Tax=Singulisphaera acidiphila (strain ATCC BAA-1392 / DSM 18658 / VKM B-2454 / MOB10) TaxID=886293 RepID=L0DMD1_SINAD|nr:DUF1553 domain-containing protein [Singulisphaera acidiphila]AGA29841.1 Protein of unknown function (DUF1553)/Protein of unknown function (DUF1549)/Planctomycete cytochrome C [Singulisphaera acidiphila DSM 18658]